MKSFHPTAGATKNIAATTSSQSVQLAKGGSSTGTEQYRIYNSTAVTAFIRAGADSSTTATAADVPIAPGSVEVMSFNIGHASPNDGLWVAAILASGTGTIYFTPGVGI